MLNQPTVHRVPKLLFDQDAIEYAFCSLSSFSLLYLYERYLFPPVYPLCVMIYQHYCQLGANVRPNNLKSKTQNGDANLKSQNDFFQDFDLAQ